MAEYRNAKVRTESVYRSPKEVDEIGSPMHFSTASSSVIKRLRTRLWASTNVPYAAPRDLRDRTNSSTLAPFPSTTLSVISHFSTATESGSVLAAFEGGEEEELTLQAFDGSPDLSDAADARAMGGYSCTNAKK